MFVSYQTRVHGRRLFMSLVLVTFLSPSSLTTPAKVKLEHLLLSKASTPGRTASYGVGASGLHSSLDCWCKG